MYYLFYCPDFNISSYQLAFIHPTKHSCIANWEATVPRAVNQSIQDFSTCQGSVHTPEARIKRFQTSHNNTKTLHLIAQAPTPQDFYTLYPELFL